MADQLDKRIGEQLREITGTDDKTRFPLMSGVVRGYDEDANTVTVELTLDDASAPTEDVTLSVLMGNVLGMYGVPSDGANCIVGEVDGPGKWQMIWAEQYDSIILRGDALGGLPIVQKVADNLKTLSDYIKNTLEPAIKNGITAVGVGGSANGTTGATAFDSAVSAQMITFEDMENKKVKQG